MFFIGKKIRRNSLLMQQVFTFLLFAIVLLCLFPLYAIQKGVKPYSDNVFITIEQPKLIRNIRV